MGGKNDDAALLLTTKTMAKQVDPNVLSKIKKGTDIYLTPLGISD